MEEKDKEEKNTRSKEVVMGVVKIDSKKGGKVKVKLFPLGSLSGETYGEVEESVSRFCSNLVNAEEVHIVFTGEYVGVVYRERSNN